MSETAITYRTSRDGPDARRISRTLTGLVAWIDDTYTPQEEITYSRNRCRTRIVSSRTKLDAITYRDVDLSVHGAYGACQGKYHPQGAGLAAFRIEENAFWDTTAIQGSLMPVSDGVVYATTQLEREKFTEDELGLEVQGVTRWNRTFDTPAELAEHLETVRGLCIGIVTMREAAELLIGNPAGITDRNFLDVYAS